MTSPVSAQGGLRVKQKNGMIKLKPKTLTLIMEKKLRILCINMLRGFLCLKSQQYLVLIHKVDLVRIFCFMLHLGLLCWHLFVTALLMKTYIYEQASSSQIFTSPTPIKTICSIVAPLPTLKF